MENGFITVSAFQRAYNGPGLPLTIDGILGPLTIAATELLPLVSAHFEASELWCHHCHQVAVRRELLVGLENLRRAWGRPIVLSSAYRCPAHNAAVGGAKQSMHVLGAAADIEILRTKIPMSVAEGAYQFSGIGTRLQGQLASHVDVRHLMGRANLTPLATVVKPFIWPYD